MARYHIYKHLSKRWKIQYTCSKDDCGECDDIKRIIYLSIPLIKKARKPEVKDTIYHEIVHAIVGTEHQHNDKWKKMAKSFNVIPKMKS